MSENTAKREVSVVVPVYNEEENIPILVKQLKDALTEIGRSFELVLVDDGSTDNSYEVMRDLKKESDFLHLVKFKTNCGQTAAFDAGLRAAVGDIVVTLDADLQYDPRDIGKLLELYEPDLVVCGRRAKREDSFVKRASSRIANWVRNKLTHESIQDTGCSLKVFPKECVKRFKLFEGMHRFFPTLARLNGFRIKEVDVQHFPRRHGTSKYTTLNRVFVSFRDCLAVRWMQRRYLRYEIESEEK
ncbi:MAG: glycosyltransferase family 2 protein [Planctomycetes bacterium]|nr:glycosyltransferase family 2 protein [Planctomycetota bacterium]